jgi:hypothetical protein
MRESVESEISSQLVPIKISKCDHAFCILQSKRTSRDKAIGGESFLRKWPESRCVVEKEKGE